MKYLTTAKRIQMLILEIKTLKRALKSYKKCNQGGNVATLLLGTVATLIYFHVLTEMLPTF